ncbi:hypothetical protein BJ912DRAFT_929904 [Pholiota molesta]|nr:hypothetical protein BJ912DRAFT_929904 [Pholiota molesta]
MPPKSPAKKKSALVFESDDEAPMPLPKTPKKKVVRKVELSEEESPSPVRNVGSDKRLHPRSPSPLTEHDSEEDQFIDDEAREAVPDDEDQDSDNSLGDFIVSDNDVDKPSPKKGKRLPRVNKRQEGFDTEDDIEATTTISVAATQAKGKGSKSKKTEVVDSDDEVEIVETPSAKTPVKKVKGSAKTVGSTKKVTPAKAAKTTPKLSTRNKGKGKKAISPEFVVSEAEALADLPLQGDDTMYNGPPASQRVISNKRPLPVTPPLLTRSAASEITPKAETPMESPTKKRCGRVDQDSELPINSSKAKAGPFHRSVRALSKDGDSDYDETLAPSLSQDEGGSPKKALFLADLTNLSIKSLPTTCEVDDPNLYDPLLDSLDAYRDLPALLKCDIKTAGNKIFTGRPNGHFMFQNWPQVLPKLKISPAVGVITFTQDDNVVNLSRVAPMSLTGRLLNHNRYELCVDGRTAICITPIIAIDSYLNRDPPNLQSPYHSLRGIFHAFEWQRYCSVLGMLANQTTMGGPVWNDHVTFQTKGQSNVQVSGSGSTSSSLPASFFNTFKSPSKSDKLGKADKKALVPLESSDRIPVYDGRRASKNIVWTGEIFNNLEDTFPRWNDPEIPTTAFVVVGYLVYLHAPSSGQGEWRVLNYIQWALVLASPDA